MGPAHTYVATVNALTSNEVTVARELWTVSLTSSETSFAAGDTVTLTATANQDPSETGYNYSYSHYNYIVRIFDTTTGGQLDWCNTAVCTFSTTALFTMGAAHTYVAEVSAGSTYVSYGDSSDVQATSDPVTESRSEWTVGLTVDKTTFAAGDTVTLTAVANQDPESTGYNYSLSAYNYMVRIFDTTAGIELAYCYTAVCTFSSSALFYSGDPHNYVAEVSSGRTSATYGATSDVQATSDSVTVARATWAVTLATDASTFDAGQDVTLTATANQLASATGGAYKVKIYDATAGVLLTSCSTLICTYTGPLFVSGPAHSYRAEVSSGSDPSYTAYGSTTDVQATSGFISETRSAWVLFLTSDESYFPVGGHSTMVSTANQDLSNTGGAYWIYIIDETSGSIVNYCVSTTSCFAYGSFIAGPAHTFYAVVADSGQRYATDVTALTGVQQTSNTVVLSREPWTISLTESSSSTLNAAANQNTSYEDWYYQIVIEDYTAGSSLGSCVGWGSTCIQYPGGASHSNVAVIAHVNPDGSISDIQSQSNSVLSTTPVSPSELQGGANGSENAQCGCGGDPINTQTGEFDTSATDLTIPGSGPTLTAARTYSSADAAADGPFGHGWSPDFSSTLSVVTPGDITDALPRQVQVTQENGATVEFTENEDHTYSAASRVLATLTNDPVSGDWTFTRRATQVMVFNPAGDLIAAKDLHGNAVAVNYDGSGEVDELSASGGRSISFTWTAGHITEAEDSAGRSVTYGYDSSDNLTSVTDVDGNTTNYGYAAGHLLTTLENPDGGTTTNVYNSSDQVVSQTDPVGRITTFDYVGGTTYLVKPDTTVTVDEYTDGFLASRTLDAGASDAETTAYTYDSASNIATVTDPREK